MYFVNHTAADGKWENNQCCLFEEVSKIITMQVCSYVATFQFSTTSATVR